MFINTETLAEDKSHWTNYSLFDTQAGLWYTLAWYRPEYSIQNDTVYVHILSAATPGGEYTGGVKYYGQEAIDFWRKLATIVNGELGLTEWMAARADRAQEILDTVPEPRDLVTVGYEDDLPY